MYSLLIPSNVKKCQKKAKGIKKHFVRKNVRYTDFLDVLRRTKNNTIARFNTFRSKNHIVNTVQLSKLCLSALDDKRYILKDGVHTLAHGHWRLGK